MTWKLGDLKTLRYIDRYRDLRDGGVPFRVTARLLSAACIRDYLCLDGLLAYGVAIEELGEDFWRSGQREAPILDIPVPLARIPLGGSRGKGRGHRWHVWAGSAVVVGDVVAYDVIRARRRWEDAPQYERYVRIARGRGKINEKAGEFKAADIPVPVSMPDVLTWFGRGDPDEALRLLQDHIPAVGHRRGQGHGRVAEWIIEPASTSEAIVRADGALARPVPVGEAGASSWDRVGLVAYRSPYYEPRHRRLCALPGAVLVGDAPLWYRHESHRAEA